MRGPSARWVRGLAAAGVLAAGLVARPAYAVFGFGDLVYDPVNYGSAVLRYVQLYKQTENQVAQLRHVYDQAKGFRDFRLADFDQLLGEVVDMAGTGAPLGYGQSGLDRLFRQAYPPIKDAAYSVLAPADRKALDGMRLHAYALIMSTQKQSFGLRAAQQALSDAKRLAANAATDQQNEQAQAAIQALAVDEAQAARALQIAVANQQAVQAAESNQRDADDRAALAGMGKQGDAQRRIEEAQAELRAQELEAARRDRRRRPAYGAEQVVIP